MSDNQKQPPDSPSESDTGEEATEPAPPFEPDFDAITYIERGPSPRYTEKRTRRN